jgi:hypothetical protein
MAVPMVKSSWSTIKISSSFWVVPMSSGALRKFPTAALAAVSGKMVTPSGDDQGKSFYGVGSTLQYPPSETRPKEALLLVTALEMAV